MEVFDMIFPLKSSWLEWTNGEVLAIYRHTGHHQNPKCVLLYSEEKMNLMPLTFQFAVSECSRDGHVVTITQTAPKQLPKQVHGMPRPDPATIKHLKMIYMASATDLVNYFAGIHQMALFPDLIVVENLQNYAKQQGVDSAPHTLARLLSMMKDAAKYISDKRIQQCIIVASIIDPGAMLKQICTRYATHMLRFSGSSSGPEFQAAVEIPRPLTSASDPQNTSAPVIRYTEEGNCLRLKDIIRKPKR